MLPPDFWPDFALRLLFALVGGALLGFDRTTRGRPAGMRTTMLVCLAAAGAMMLGQSLLDRHPESPVRFDPLRIAQGILAGMGFIGAGAIVRRDDAVLGVTTAATLWLSTILGLCFGAGEWMLGCGVLGAGVIVLWACHPLEDMLHRERQARLRVKTGPGGPDEAALRERIKAAGYRSVLWTHSADRDTGVHTAACVVRWRARPWAEHVPEFVHDLMRDERVLSVRWEPAA